MNFLTNIVTGSTDNKITWQTTPHFGPQTQKGFSLEDSCHRENIVITPTSLHLKCVSTNIFSFYGLKQMVWKASVVQFVLYISINKYFPQPSMFNYEEDSLIQWVHHHDSVGFIHMANDLRCSQMAGVHHHNVQLQRRWRLSPLPLNNCVQKLLEWSPTWGSDQCIFGH